MLKIGYDDSILNRDVGYLKTIFGTMFKTGH